MVFFVCEGCNETLKKNQVDKHALRCKSCHAVTCVDCQKVFYGDDYSAHIECISEAEKYEKSLFKGKKEKVNPQDQWMSVIEDAASQSSSAPQSIRQHLTRLCEVGSNVPRNKNKFGNFVKNSLRIHSQVQIDEIWNFLEKLKPKQEVTTQKTEVKTLTNTDLNLDDTSINGKESSMTQPEVKLNVDLKVYLSGDSKVEKRAKKHKDSKTEKSIEIVDSIESTKESIENEIVSQLDAPSLTTSESNGEIKKKKKKKRKNVEVSSSELSIEENSYEECIIESLEIKSKKIKKSERDVEDSGGAAILEINNVMEENADSSGSKKKKKKKKIKNILMDVLDESNLN